MRLAPRVLCLALLSAVAVPAAAQEKQPAYSSSALIRMLTPKPSTRGIRPAAGIADDVSRPPRASAPEEEGGRVPDLKILFPFNSAELTPDAKRQLDELGHAMTSDTLRSFSFEIAGHTDAAGPREYNESLSFRRAEAAVRYLEEQFGIDRNRLRPKGYGMARLADAAAPYSPRNRRVEVVTLQ